MSYIETLEDLLDKDGFECVDKDSFLKSAHYRYDSGVATGQFSIFNDVDVKVRKLKKSLLVEVNIEAFCSTDDEYESYDCNFIHHVSVGSGSVVDLYHHIKVELLHLCRSAEVDGF